MKLYSAPLSLFAKKVEIALAEKGLAFERVLVAFSQTTGYAPKHKDVVAANPKAQVPVLIDADVTLYDSTIILEYLEDAYPMPPLYPAGAAARADCRLLELYADEIMLAEVRQLMHRTAPRPSDPARWIDLESKAEGAEATLAEQFADLERRLGPSPYFFDALSVADIALFVTIHYSLRLGGPGIGDFARLAAWYRRLLERPAFASVVADIAAADAELSAPVANAFRGAR